MGKGKFIAGRKVVVNKRILGGKGMANPATVWAKNQGYSHRIQKDTQGNEYGEALIDGQWVEEWSAYRANKPKPKPKPYIRPKPRPKPKPKPYIRPKPRPKPKPKPYIRPKPRPRLKPYIRPRPKPYIRPKPYPIVKKRKVKKPIKQKKYVKRKSKRINNNKDFPLAIRFP